MNILTPTSEGGGLLDLAALNQLAGEFFSALTTSAPQALGGVPAPTHPLPGGTSLGPLANGPALPGTLAPGANLAPTNPQSVLNLGASTPSVLPHGAAPNGLPDHAAIVPPAVDGRVGGIALGVPEAYAAALPAHDAPSTGGAPLGTASTAPQSPYYFIGEGQTAAPAAAPLANAPDDRVTAQSFGLPGAEALRALLTANQPALPVAAPGLEHAPGHPSQAQAYSPAGHPSTSPFYFVDPARSPHGYAGAVPQADHSRQVLFDVHAVRRDFPILQERVNGQQLVWFDNAATTQKPQAVIDRLSYFYQHENSNIHRAAHELAARATDAYEGARNKVARFIGAGSVDEIIFVRGATEAINLVAQSWGRQNIVEGDEIIVSHLEHHANIVPWQMLAAEKGAKLRVIPVDDSGQVLLNEYGKLLNSRTKLVSVTQVSNALGTVVPVAEIVAMAHRAGAKALVDGAQSVSHMRVNVQALDADFFVFSGHKVFAPTGIGVVYGKREVLEDMQPWQGGGNMIQDVSFERTVYHGPPARFEAGTGNIADAVGLGAAIDYVERIGMENIARYEHDLLVYATRGLCTVPGLCLIGTAQDKASVLSFVLEGFKTEEVGKALNQDGIAVRSGHHCAQPILRRFGLEATVRPSLAFYNTCEEVDRLVASLRRLTSARR